MVQSNTGCGRGYGSPEVLRQAFIACQNAAWDGVAGPDTSRTLEGVNFLLRVPPDTEFPFEQPELWLYARLIRTNDVAGTCDLAVELWWHDGPTGAELLGTQPVGSVRFPTDRSVVHRAWAFRPLMLPGEGLFEFRLVRPSRRSWATQPRRLANEFLMVRRSQ